MRRTRTSLAGAVATAAAASLTVGCGGEDGATAQGPGGDSDGGGGVSTTAGSGGGEAPGAGGGGAETLPLPEDQPAPVTGGGVSDPASTSLHGRGCGGVDWQRIHGWLLLPHAAPEVGPADEMDRCVERYAGWVTHAADDAGVSRASVYAALAASGQCDGDGDGDGDGGYDGSTLLPGEVCTLAHPELDASACITKMAELRSFGVETVASALAAGNDAHKGDVPPMAAFLAEGAIACGGDDRWKLVAPAGFIDRYVAAYNAYKARSADPPACKKRLVVSVALYTGMDDPGADGVAAANGCWTYERISKTNSEWKICNYDGTVHHPDGTKWVYDDTNTDHDAATDKARINACKKSVPGRGYVYMTNRGSGWPKRVTEGVEVHYAEIYSGQYAIADQLGLWKSAGKPGQPMVNFGEPTTGAAKIGEVTADVCATVADGGWLGVYVYPEPLRANRMSAMVEALNACTAK